METVTNTLTKSSDLKILYLLDESGSMQVMGNEPVSALNAFVKDQRSLFKDDDKTTLTLFTFNDRTKLKVDNLILSEVKIFEHNKDYLPSGLTALYDAISKAIDHMKTKEDYKNVICVILTDGEENASITATKDSVKNQIDDLQSNYGWKFIYVGANQDSYKEGSKIGVTNCSDFETCPGGLLKITRGISDGISRHRSCGDDATINLPPVPINTKAANLDINDVSDVDLLKSPRTPTSPPKLFLKRYNACSFDDIDIINNV